MCFLRSACSSCPCGSFCPILVYVNGYVPGKVSAGSFVLICVSCYLAPIFLSWFYLRVTALYSVALIFRCFFGSFVLFPGYCLFFRVSLWIFCWNVVNQQHVLLWRLVLRWRHSFLVVLVDLFLFLFSNCPFCSLCFLWDLVFTQLTPRWLIEGQGSICNHQTSPTPKE